jgi:DNA-binding transcriptional regulator YhcF (GntR family)
MIIERKSKAYLIANEYEKELLETRVPVGNKVLSARQLAIKYNISNSTAHKVLTILAEKDIIEKKYKSSSSVKKDLCKRITIGFTEVELSPFEEDIFRLKHFELANKKFKEHNLDVHHISYATLQNKEKCEELFSSLDGLLVKADYCDSKTLPQLQKFNKPIVVIDELLFVTELLSCQVTIDWLHALDALEDSISKYKKLLILSADHLKAQGKAKYLIDKFPNKEITVEILRDKNAQLAAFKYFLKNNNIPKDTLVIALSGWYSQGLRDAYSDDEKLPAVIEFDNLEKYLPGGEQTAVFTSIDCMLEEIYNRSVNLLCEQITNNDLSRHIIEIPAKVIFRKTFN